MDDVPGNASMHSHIQCSSALGRICVHAIYPRSTTMDHLQVEDNHFAALGAANVLLRSIIEMKDVEGGGEHPHLKDNIQVRSSIPPETQCDVGPMILCPNHSHELVCLQQGSTVQRKLKTKSLNSLLPLRRSKSPCTACNGDSFLFRDHITRRTTPLIL